MRPLVGSNHNVILKCYTNEELKRSMHRVEILTAPRAWGTSARKYLFVRGVSGVIYPFYQSSGENSGFSGCWLPFLGFNTRKFCYPMGWVMKPQLFMKHEECDESILAKLLPDEPQLQQRICSLECFFIAYLLNKKNEKFIKAIHFPADFYDQYFWILKWGDFGGLPGAEKLSASPTSCSLTTSHEYSLANLDIIKHTKIYLLMGGGLPGINILNGKNSRLFNILLGLQNNTLPLDARVSSYQPVDPTVFYGLVDGARASFLKKFPTYNRLLDEVFTVLKQAVVQCFLEGGSMLNIQDQAILINCLTNFSHLLDDQLAISGFADFTQTIKAPWQEPQSATACAATSPRLLSETT